MAKYRKKPVVIEAVQFNVGDPQPEWVTDSIFNGTIQVFDDHATIITLEGAMTANLGDYIIKGVQGEIYPCKPDIFLMSYEKENESDVNNITVNFNITPAEKFDLDAATKIMNRMMKESFSKR
jgi:hypothetical protein